MNKSRNPKFEYISACCGTRAWQKIVQYAVNVHSLNNHGNNVVPHRDLRTTLFDKTAPVLTHIKCGDTTAVA